MARLLRLSASAALLALAGLLLVSGVGPAETAAGASSVATTSAGSEAAAPAPAEPSRNRREQAGDDLRAELRSAPHDLREVGETLVARAIEHVPGMITGAVLLLLFWGLGRLTARLLRRVLNRGTADPALANVAIPLARFAVYGLGVVAAMEQMGFNVGSLLAGFGVAGLAVGLAAQETLGSIFAGFVLLWDRPFRLGDAVTISGTFGHVTEIGLRSTRLRTLEHREVTIPNRQVIQEQIVNHTRYPFVRVNVPLAVGYGADLDQVRQVLIGSLSDNSAVRPEPAPQVVVVALGESAVQVELRVWIADLNAERGSLFSLLESAKRALDAAGVEIPFPQRTLRLIGGAPDGATR